MALKGVLLPPPAVNREEGSAILMRPNEDKSAVPSCHCPGDMAVHMRNPYWPYRGVDIVCFCAEYVLVVLCLGLEAGELSTRAQVNISAHISKVCVCAQVIFGQ